MPVTAGTQRGAGCRAERIGMEKRASSRPRTSAGYADWLHATGKPTVLMYGHYDVQPLIRSTSGIRRRSSRQNGWKLYARGAVDDKARCTCTSRRSNRCCHEWQAAAQRARAV